MGNAFIPGASCTSRGPRVEVKFEKYVLPADFPKFEGSVVTRGPTEEYLNCSHQYATSSQTMGVLAPAAIIYAANEQDIIRAIEYAHKAGIAISNRSGGHHYMGASSCAGNNIQLDMSGYMWKQTHPDVPYAFNYITYDEATNTLTSGPATDLDDFSSFCQSKGVFLPFGECPRVHIGGHAQTGGTGTASRTFGLLCDHIHSITLITAEGGGENGSVARKRTIYRDSTDKDDQDIFFSTIGGSPGNFGVLVKVEFRPILDSSFPHSRGMQLVYVYTKERFERLMNLYTKYVDEDKLPQAFSFSVVAVGSAQVIHPDLLDEEFMKNAPQFYWANFGEGEKVKVELFSNPWMRPCSTIVVNGLWADATNPQRSYEDAKEAQEFFAAIKEAANGTSLQDWLTDLVSLGFDAFGAVLGSVFDNTNYTPLSHIMRRFTIPLAREWTLPFHHRFMLTTSTSLVKSNFVKLAADRLDPLLRYKAEPKYSEFKASEQYIPLGKNSAWTTMADGKTSVSFRSDSTGVGTATFFFPEHQRALANEWDKGNYKLYIGPNGCFTPVDRRFIWAPYGNDWNLDENWEKFFDSREKYNRVLATKKKFDPHDIFTPNLFCIGASTSEKLKRNTQGVKYGKPKN